MFISTAGVLLLQVAVVDDESYTHGQGTQEQGGGEEGDRGCDAVPGGLCWEHVDHGHAVDQDQSNQGGQPGQGSAHSGAAPLEELHEGIEETECGEDDAEQDLTAEPGGAEVGNSGVGFQRAAEVEQGSQQAEAEDDDDGDQGAVTHQVGSFLSGLAHGEELNHAQDDESAYGHLHQDGEGDQDKFS